VVRVPFALGSYEGLTVSRAEGGSRFAIRAFLYAGSWLSPSREAAHDMIGVGVGPIVAGARRGGHALEVGGQDDFPAAFSVIFSEAPWGSNRYYYRDARLIFSSRNVSVARGYRRVPVDMAVPLGSSYYFDPSFVSRVHEAMERMGSAKQEMARRVVSHGQQISKNVYYYRGRYYTRHGTPLPALRRAAQDLAAQDLDYDIIDYVQPHPLQRLLALKRVIDRYRENGG